MKESTFLPEWDVLYSFVVDDKRNEKPFSLKLFLSHPLNSIYLQACRQQFQDCRFRTPDLGPSYIQQRHPMDWMNANTGGYCKGLFHQNIT